MLGKTKSKKKSGKSPLHPVLARAQDAGSNSDHQFTTMTEKELQEKIRQNRKKQQEKKKTVRKMEKDQSFSPVQGVMGFLIALALGWWALKQLATESGAISFDQYNIARMVLLVSMYTMVLIIAFRQSFPLGFMSLMFPPAMLYFIAIPMESSALKGLIGGFLVVAFLEVDQLEKKSMYAIASKQYGMITASGRDLLNAGSDEKFYK